MIFNVLADQMIFRCSDAEREWTQVDEEMVDNAGRCGQELK
jgi:hypothetical protein